MANAIFVKGAKPRIETSPKKIVEFYFLFSLIYFFKHKNIFFDISIKENYVPGYCETIC